MNRFLFSTLLITVAFVFLSCNRAKKIDVSHIQVRLNVEHFDQDLFALDPAKLSEQVPVLQNKYGSFFYLYHLQIIKIGSPEQPSFYPLLNQFITNYDINQLYKATQEIFADTATLTQQLTNAFKYFRYYFPEKPVPQRVVTYLSALNQSIVTTDSIIGIGLDKYLGTNHPIYKKSGINQYLTQRMYPEKIVSDALSGWLWSQYEPAEPNSRLMDEMLFQGKILYVTRQLLPDAPDSVIFGYSQKQLDWLNRNEHQMWTYLVEQKLLFTTDLFTISKFVNEAPFTKDFTNDSPGKAALWMGYRIVDRFMQRNKEITLTKLMELSDSQELLQNARYNP